MFYLLGLALIHFLASSALGAMGILSLKALRTLRKEAPP